MTGSYGTSESCDRKWSQRYDLIGGEEILHSKCTKSIGGPTEGNRKWPCQAGRREIKGKGEVLWRRNNLSQHMPKNTQAAWFPCSFHKGALKKKVSLHGATIQQGRFHDLSADADPSSLDRWDCMKARLKPSTPDNWEEHGEWGGKGWASKWEQGDTREEWSNDSWRRAWGREEEGGRIKF